MLGMRDFPLGATRCGLGSSGLGFGLRVKGSGLRVYWFRVWGLGFRVLVGLGF